MPKKRSKNQQLEAVSRGKIGVFFSEWIVNDLNNDFGFDFEVSICDTIDDREQSVTGFNFYIQLKSSASCSNGIYYDLSTIDIELYLSQQIPVVLVKYCEDTDSLWWEIVQNYVWDVLNRADANWKENKFKRIQFSNKLEDLNILEKEIYKSQSRINRYHFLELGIGEGIRISKEDISELTNHKNRSLEEFKSLSLIEADIHFKTGNVEETIKKLYDVYDSPNEDVYKLKSIIGLTSFLNILQNEENKKIVDLCNEGIDLAQKIGYDNLEKYITIIQNEAFFYLSVTKISQLSLSRKIQDIFEENIFSFFYNEELIKMFKIHQSIVQNLNDSLIYLLEKKYVFEYILSLASIVEMIAYQILTFACFDDKIIKEEEVTRLNLVSQCEYVVENIQDTEILKPVIRSLSMYNYYISKTDEALYYANMAIEIGDADGDKKYLKSMEAFLDIIMTNPNPYETKETKPIDDMSCSEYQEFTKNCIVAQGINLEAEDELTEFINIALRDMDPSVYFRHCEHLHLDYISTSPVGRSIGLPSMGSKRIGCSISGYVEGVDLDHIFIFFRDNNCMGCKQHKPRKDDWGCTVKWVKEQALEI
jgi:hypothetical protein